MFYFCQADEYIGVEVEFDEYVPVTMTWPEARHLLEPPIYVIYSQEHVLFELKFSPSSHRLVEAVLVNAPAIHCKGVSLPLTSDDEKLSVCLRQGYGREPVRLNLIEIVSFDRYLLIKLADDDPVRWVGKSPVLFGQGVTGDLVALSILWNPEDRARVLPGC